MLCLDVLPLSCNLEFLVHVAPTYVYSGALHYGNPWEQESAQGVCILEVSQ